MNIELWQDIENFSRYEISDWGNVRNIKNKHPLKQTKTKSGLYVYFRNDKDKLCGRAVHVLVGTAFVENPNNYKFISFIDNDLFNPIATNLRFVNNVRIASRSRKEYKTQQIKREPNYDWLENIRKQVQEYDDKLNYFKTKR